MGTPKVRIDITKLAEYYVEHTGSHLNALATLNGLINNISKEEISLQNTLNSLRQDKIKYLQIKEVIKTKL